MEGYLDYTHEEKIEILKQLKIWNKMTKEERNTFSLCTSDYRADRLMRDLRNKYLM